MDTNMIHINRIWWAIANTIRPSHFISSGVTPYAEEQLTLVVKKSKVESSGCLSVLHREGRLLGAQEHSWSPTLSFWTLLSVLSCNVSTFWIWAGKEDFLLHSQAVVPELWSLKYHVTWSCLGGPRSDRINILLFLPWWVLAARGTGRESVPRALAIP